MSSVSWARAPTRRASAETAACSGGLAAAFSLGPVATGRHAQRSAGDEGEDEEHGGAAEHDPQPADQPGLRTCSLGRAALLGVRGASGRVEELALGVGERGLAAALPVQDPGQPDAAVELAVGATEGVPGVGRGGQVVQDPLPLDVVVEPAAQPGPGPGERLVGDLQDAVVAGHQPGADEQLDQLVVLGVVGDQPAGHPAAHRLALGARARPAGGRGHAAGVAGSTSIRA